MILRAKDRQALRHIFDQQLHGQGLQVLAYGSRVTGEAHEGSDLDLVIRALDGKRCDLSVLAGTQEAIGESTIPILVELRDYYRLPASFQSEIDKVAQVLWA